MWFAWRINVKKIVIGMWIGLCLICSMSTVKEKNVWAAESVAQWKKQKTGSAGVLVGKSVLISIFVDDANSHWNEKKKKEINRKLKVATSFIQTQGKRYKKEVILEADFVKHPELQYCMKTKMRLTDKEKKLNSFGEKMESYIEKHIDVTKIREEYDTDSIGFLLFINKSGVSSTSVHYMEDGTKHFYEMCALFSQYEKEEEGAATFAHEILHLFGARDLYMTSVTDGISSALVRHIQRKFPNDIMFTTFTKKGKTLKYRIVNRVDRVTAYYLGWKKSIPEKKSFALYQGEKGCFTDGTSW